MPDSTHRPATRRRPRLPAAPARVWACALLALAVTAGAPATAVADGDPASDVLASQTVYVPGDGGFDPARTAQLSRLLTEARRAGVPIRVALIATRADLGSVTELWGKPQSYAEFLGQELSQVYRGTLVVAMPAGVGIAAVSDVAGTASQPRVSVPRGPVLSTAIRAAQAIAAAHGHRLTLPQGTATPSSGSALGSVDLGSWLALAAGASLIALAWTASLRAQGLRARPLRPPRVRRAR